LPEGASKTERVDRFSDRLKRSGVAVPSGIYMPSQRPVDESTVDGPRFFCQGEGRRRDAAEGAASRASWGLLAEANDAAVAGRDPESAVSGERQAVEADDRQGRGGGRSLERISEPS